MRLLLTLIISMTFAFAIGQKRPLVEDYSRVVEMARHDIENSMKGPEGELFLYVQELNLTGKYDFDITLHEKGEVATVFVKGKEGGTIKMQNNLKDFVKAMKFSFKMPKGKDYKFNHVFNFNN